MIENLPLLAPDSSRVARTLTRCHDTLAAERRRIEARTRQPNPKTGTVERLLLAGVCVGYLISMADNVIRVIGPR